MKLYSPSQFGDINSSNGGSCLDSPGCGGTRSAYILWRICHDSTSVVELLSGLCGIGLSEVSPFCVIVCLKASYELWGWQKFWFMIWDAGPFKFILYICPLSVISGEPEGVVYLEACMKWNPKPCESCFLAWARLLRIPALPCSLPSVPLSLRHIILD